MAFNMWIIFLSLLLVSVGANRYDQGPQKFYDVTSDTETAEQNENKEVVLYLTPEQVRALEADGAVVQSEDPEGDEADNEEQVNEDQDEASEQEENEDAQEEEEAQQEEQENPEDVQNQDIDFEEILRILNEDQVQEEEVDEASEEQARNEPQVEEENTESPRNFSPRITIRQQLEQQQQQEEKYLAPAVAKKEQVLKSYSLIRYQPNEQRTQQRQRINVQLLQQQLEEANAAAESSEEPQTETAAQEKKKYKLIPYEVVETPASEENAETQAQEAQNAEAEDDAQKLNDLIAPLVNAARSNVANNERRNRLQSILRELKASPKYNDQKFAIEIENLRTNLEKQNAALRAETIAKVTPSLIKQQLSKKGGLNKSKQGKSQKLQQAKAQRNSAPAANARSIAVPVIKAEKSEVQRPIPVQVDTNKRVSVKNVYVRTRTDKPFIISRRVPENKRQTRAEVPTSKPERITILRHIWEQ